MILVLVIFGLLAATGTLLELGLQLDGQIASEQMKQIFVNFSVITNTKKIFNTNIHPESISCINGIRFLSMSWVLISHAYSFFQGR